MSEHVRLADHIGNAGPVLMALAWRDGTSSRSWCSTPVRASCAITKTAEVC